MRHFMILVSSVVAMALAFGGVAQAAVMLDGTLSGTDYNTVRDDGDGNHAYAIDRSAANTFYWSNGSTVRITGTADVRGLTSGSYLQIGLVDKPLADKALSDPTEETWWSGQMFNNSAVATFYRGTANYARLADTNSLYSSQLFNPGATVGVFDFTLEISSDGTMGLTLHGPGGDVSNSYTYGTCNWPAARMDAAGLVDDELVSGAYLISQVWLDTGSTTVPVSASFDISGTSVPEPGTLALLLAAGLGAIGCVWRRRS